MEMEAGIWSGLPSEILEKVLAFVPVPDLCRYRAVCKAWDRLITDHRFAARHNAASTSYIVMSYSRRFKDYSPRFKDYSPRFKDHWFRPRFTSSGKQKRTHLGRYCILDVRARRWYTVEYDECYRFMQQDFESMAMDGGLVCQYLETEEKGHAVLVHNPIARTGRVLPVAPSHDTSMGYLELSLAVDVASAAFKVFLINHSINRWSCGRMPVTVFNDIRKDPPLRVYESATNEWRSMGLPAWVNAGMGHLRRCIMLRGWMYVLFGETAYPFWRYDIAEDVWERLATPFTHIPKYPELVVSDQRLFLAAWYCKRGSRASLDGGVRERKWFYKLFEVKDFARPYYMVMDEEGNVDVERLWETVFDHSKEKMVALFENNAKDYACEYYHMSMFGMGSCLLFMSNSTGKAMTFDVATRTWDRDWPRNPLGDQLLREGADCSWVGEHMNLLLPRTRWYVKT